MSSPVALFAITAAFMDRMLAFLTPFFLIGIPDDPVAARMAAREVLCSYGPRTNKELRLAALNIAFSFGALDSLSKSLAMDLTVNQILRMRNGANALNRAALKSQDALDQLQKTGMESIDEQPLDDLPASIETTDLLTFTRPNRPVQAAPLSRQQRRAAERQAGKASLQQQEATRRLERVARASASLPANASDRRVMSGAFNATSPTAAPPAA